jgi:ribulose-phosphate 3-epimerase
MKKDYKITPSILGADLAHLGDEIAIVEKNGASWIHVDVMDGHFVPNLTIGFAVVEACKRSTELPLDVHLMVDEPEKWIERFRNAGADHLTVHVETCPNLPGTIDKIKQLGCKAAVTLRPDTPAEGVKPVLGMIDHVLVMTVYPGYSGQKFMPEMMPKVKTIRAWLDEVNPEAPIQVDGGINSETLPTVIEAGAEVFVSASAIFKHPQGTAAGIQALWDTIHSIT